MNSTSFTSIDPTGALGGNVNDKNIDTSSTAHLTLDAASNVGGGSTCRLTRASGDTSSSSPEQSPSVHVLTSGNGHHTNHHLHHSHSSSNNNNNYLNNHHHHHHHHHHSSSLPRAGHLLAGGFSFTNRLQNLTTKHQRTLWSRATHFEKILMLALVVLCAICVVLFISLTSLLMRQQRTTTTSAQLNKDEHLSSGEGSYQPPEGGTTLFPLKSEQVCVNNRTESYCLTPDCVKVAASVIEAIDTSVNPCDDFYVSSGYENVTLHTKQFKITSNLI